MKEPLKTTIKDIAEIISALEDKGVGVKITLVPIQRDNKIDHPTEKGGVKE